MRINTFVCYGNKLLLLNISIQCLDIKHSVVLSSPSPVNREKTIFIITIQNKTMTTLIRSSSKNNRNLCGNRTVQSRIKLIRTFKHQGMQRKSCIKRKIIPQSTDCRCHLRSTTRCCILHIDRSTTNHHQLCYSLGLLFSIIRLIDRYHVRPIQRIVIQLYRNRFLYTRTWIKAICMLTHSLFRMLIVKHCLCHSCCHTSCRIMFGSPIARVRRT